MCGVVTPVVLHFVLSVVAKCVRLLQVQCLIVQVSEQTLVPLELSQLVKEEVGRHNLLPQ